MYKTLALSLIAALAASRAAAAPLDALLSANHTPETGRYEVELAYDLANRSVDFLNLRPKRTDGKPYRSGDYEGGHIRLGAALTDRVWVDGALWRRQLDYTSVTAEVTSWQVGAQLKVIDGADAGASLALRAGAWGNSAPELRRTSSTRVNGINFTSARQTNPRDLQLQLDAIGSLPLGSRFEVSGFAGAGASRLDFDEVTATARMNGCDYDVRFTPTHVVATCPGGTVTRIATPNAVAGIDVQREAAYRSTYLHGGVNASWRPGNWRLRAGYQYIRLDRRGGVDDIVVQRGGTPHRTNHIVVGEIGYLATRQTRLFTRAQVMKHQFVGEAPLTYNTLTATQHRRRYGVLSLGLTYGF